MFSASQGGLVFVHRMIWSRHPLMRIQSPMMRSEELISPLTSRLSSTPKDCRRLSLDCPPP